MLKKYGACIEAVDWAKTQKDKSYKALFATCIAEDHLDWVNWIITRLLNNENRVRYAIYAARQVINIYEDKYPGDDRPRKAIQAAKKYLKNPSKENAANTANTAHAAHAAHAAYAAAYAAYAADAASDAAYKDMLTKILKYGYRLLIKQENEERGK